MIGWCVGISGDVCMRVFDLDCEWMSAGRQQHQVSWVCAQRGSSGVDRLHTSTGLRLVTDAVLITHTQTQTGCRRVVVLDRFTDL